MGGYTVARDDRAEISFPCGVHARDRGVIGQAAQQQIIANDLLVPFAVCPAI